MHGARWLVLVACSAAMAFGSSAVRAGGNGTIEGGTITFVGALVAPTCNISAAQDLMNVAGGATGSLRSRQRSCGTVASAPVNTNSAQIYSTSFVHLSNAESDQVLRYFASYVRAEQSSDADPVLVTHTYE